jgi:ABC-2 type transport system permease protein
VLIAVLGTAALSLLAGLTAGLADSQQTGSIGSVWSAVGAQAAYLPAVWVLTGIVVLLFGFAPRLTLLSWGFLVGFFLLAEFGPLVNLPAWTMNLSPFTHIPRLPAAAMSWTPLVILTVLAAVLIVAGAVRFRSRDLTTA